jgi:hypothetical protein
MGSRVPNYRQLTRDIAVLVAIIVSGATLSAIVMQVTLGKIALFVVATATAVALVPRSWPRRVAFIFFMAAWFGVAVISNDYGQHVLYDTPLSRSGNEYIWQAATSILFVGAWLCWWAWARRSIKHANVDT